MLLMHSAWPTHADDAVFFGRILIALLARYNVRPLGLTRAPCVHSMSVAARVSALLRSRTFSHAAVTGIDVNPKALELATVNARLAGLHNVTLYLFW